MELEVISGKLGPRRNIRPSWFVFLGFSVMFPTGWQAASVYYTAYSPPHHCKIPEDTKLIDSVSFTDGKPASCLQYENFRKGNRTVQCSKGWVYSFDDGETIVTKWELTCTRESLWQVHLSFFAGMIIGSSLFQAFSDKFGRKSILICNQVFMALAGVASAVSNNFRVFCFFRFLTGAAQQTVLLVGFILVCELVPVLNRTFVGLVIEVFWATSLCLLPLLAYLFQDWSILQLFISLYPLFLLPFYRWVPESTLWLVANGRTRGMDIYIKQSKKFSKYKSDGKFQTPKQKSPFSFTFTDVLSSRRMMASTAILSIAWSLVGSVYYVLLFDSSKLVSNHYLSGFLTALVEIPAYIFSYVLCTLYGRRYSLMFLQLLASFTLLTDVFFATLEIKFTFIFIFFGLCSRFFVAGAFSIVFLYSIELFPANIRTMAASLIGKVGRFFHIIALYTVDTDYWVTVVVHGILSVFVTFLLFRLPETSDKNMASSFQEIEGWYDKKQKPMDSGRSQTLFTKNNSSLKTSAQLRDQYFDVNLF